MDSNDSLRPPTGKLIDEIASDLDKTGKSRTRRFIEKFLIAALGSVPWVGGLMAAGAELPGEEAAARADDLRTQWLQEHRRRLEDLAKALQHIMERFESIGAEVEERIQSPEYLAIVRQAFRVWDNAETDAKRQFVCNLVANCAGTRVCSDDVVRLFVSWLDAYHEAHFAVIRELHQNPGSTRFEMWTAIYGDLPREDSAEADLYRLLIRDLSTGGVLRQARDTTEAGEFLRRRPQKRRGPAPTTMESVFEDSKPHVLTELGKQFVHYTLMGDIRRLGPNGA